MKDSESKPVFHTFKSEKLTIRRPGDLTIALPITGDGMQICSVWSYQVHVIGRVIRNRPDEGNPLTIR
jgi:hypothetical protein